MAKKPLLCKIGAHETFGDSALYTSGVIRCSKCPWVESPELAEQLAREREIIARHREKGLNAGQLIHIVITELAKVA